MDEAAKQKRKRARREAERAMIAAAHRGDPITYLDLVKEIKSTTWRPNSKALESILTELSRVSSRAGLGMLSVVVVNGETRLPGSGFFELAESLGRTVQSEDSFFNSELEAVVESFRDIEDRIPPIPPC